MNIETHAELKKELERVLAAYNTLAKFSCCVSRGHDAEKFLNIIIRIQEKTKPTTLMDAVG